MGKKSCCVPSKLLKINILIRGSTIGEQFQEWVTCLRLVNMYMGPADASTNGWLRQLIKESMNVPTEAFKRQIGCANVS